MCQQYIEPLQFADYFIWSNKESIVLAKRIHTLLEFKAHCLVYGKALFYYYQ